MLQFLCNQCRAALKAPPHKAGLLVECPGCHQMTRVPGDPLPTITFKCRLCNATHTRLAKFAGETISCPSCKERIEIPQAPKPKPKPVEEIPFGAVLGEIVEPPPQRLPVPAKPNLPAWIDPHVQRIPAPPPPRPVAPSPVNAWVSVNVSARLLHWPPQCTCCLAPEQAETHVTFTRPGRGNRMETRSWRIPYCFRCLENYNARQSGPAVIYDGWNGSVHSFRFWNTQYAALFACANKQKLVR